MTPSEETRKRIAEKIGDQHVPISRRQQTIDAIMEGFAEYDTELSAENARLREEMAEKAESWTISNDEKSKAVIAELQRELSETKAKLAEADRTNEFLIAQSNERMKRGDELQSQLLSQSALIGKLLSNLGHIASILKDKRDSEDSTIHAGNTSFISMERWANDLGQEDK